MNMSCENEMLVNLEPFTSQVIVYGLIDPFAETNQIRVGRVFYGADGIDESVQREDSIYFENLDVSIEFTDLKYVYSSIDLESEHTDKSPGLFNNQIYKSFSLGALPMHSASLSSNQEGFTHLKMQIVSDEIPEPTLVIEKVFRKPKILQPSRFGGQLNLYSTSKWSTLIWNPPSEAEYHEISFTLFYSELIDGLVIDKVIKWSFTDPILEIEGNKQMVLDGDRFMRNISRKLSGDDVQNVKKLNTITLSFLSGSESIKDYFNSYDIAADHNGQPISNVVNGLGVVGVYTKQEVTDLELTAEGYDSLAHGRITRHLNFVKYDIGR